MECGWKPTITFWGGDTRRGSRAESFCAIFGPADDPVSYPLAVLPPGNPEPKRGPLPGPEVGIHFRPTCIPKFLVPTPFSRGIIYFSHIGEGEKKMSKVQKGKK